TAKYCGACSACGSVTRISAYFGSVVFVAAGERLTPKEELFEGVEEPRGVESISRSEPRKTCAAQFTVEPGSPSLRTTICCAVEPGLPWKVWKRIPFCERFMNAPAPAIASVMGTSN